MNEESTLSAENEEGGASSGDSVESKRPDVDPAEPERLDASDASIAPDPPDPNPRALAAEAARTGQTLADAHTATAAPTIYESEGKRVRIVGGRYYAETGEELVDRKGRPFDVSLHLVDADGRPRLSRDGYLRQRTGRAAAAADRRWRETRGPQQQATFTNRPSGDVHHLPPLRSKVATGESEGNERAGFGGASDGVSPLASAPEMSKPSSGVGSPENDAQADALASVLVETISGGAAVALGDYARATKEESSAMKTAWAAYLRTVDCSSVPPWSVPIIASMPYVTRVATHDETRSKLDRAKADAATKRNEAHRAAQESERAESETAAGPVEPAAMRDRGRGVFDSLDDPSESF